MSIAGVLGSDAALAILGTVLGGIWTVFKSSAWFRRARRTRYAKALRALEAGVELTYRTYVRAIKQAREDGKLTDDERRRARRRAREAAIEFGRRQGIDVLRELGSEYVDVWIEKIVKKLKKG